MTRGTSRTVRAASVRPVRHVSFTDRGDLVVRVPASVVELVAVLAALVGLAAVPFLAAGLVGTVASLPLALFGLAALLAGALSAPFAAVAVVAARLG